MSAPTISEPPELPTFPTGPGLPDQPGVFIPKFLAFLAWFTTFRAWLIEVIAYLEGLGGGGSSEPAVTYRPMVDGSNPPVFIIGVDNDLIFTEF